MARWILSLVIMAGLSVPMIQAQKKKQPALAPTAANVAYGIHQRQVLDFWQAKADRATPLVLYIHGGGWRGGDKKSLRPASIQQFMNEGISVAAINYR